MDYTLKDMVSQLMTMSGALHSDIHEWWDNYFASISIGPEHDYSKERHGIAFSFPHSYHVEAIYSILKYLGSWHY
jgi:hypothetical protein